MENEDSQEERKGFSLGDASQDAFGMTESLNSMANQKSGIKCEDQPSELVKDEKDQLQSRMKKWKKRMRFQPQNVVMDKDAKHEYYKKLVDSSEADNLELPRVVSVMEHATACANEIESMLSAIKQHSGNKTALQTLPRHLRRRAASHNAKRLPRRLRELAKQQAAQTSDTKNGVTNKKAITRQKRRRKLHLQNEYAKRKGKQGWLETHVWHAKRFHMSCASDPQFAGWRNRVALHPNDKCFRACYRAAAHHCLLQDISYYKCLELSGERDSLLKIFKTSTYTPDQSFLFDDSVVNGKKECTIFLYDTDVTPALCIGPASVIWQPINDNTTSDTSVWIWIHPVVLESAFKLLKSYTDLHANVRLRDCSENLLRFRLVGPKSSVTLLSTLHAFNYSKNDGEKESKEIPDEIASWLASHENIIPQQYARFMSKMKECHQAVFNPIEKDHESLDCENGSIYSLVIDDPRLTLPLQKTVPSFKSTKALCKANIDVEQPEECPTESMLWDDVILKKISSSRLPDHIVSTRIREAKLVPTEKGYSTPLPVMLIRHSGHEEAIHGEHQTVHGGPQTGFASGWDLILPSNWGMAFWIPLVYHRVRTGGLREKKRIQLECKAPHFPEDFPDTFAGMRWWQVEKQINHEKYFKKPPAKRPNFSVLASPFPFAPCWNYLFSCDDSISKTKISDDCQSVSNDDAVDCNKINSGSVLTKGTSSPAVVLLSNEASANEKLAIKPCSKRKAETAESEVIASKRTKILGHDEHFCTVFKDQSKLQLLRKLIVTKSYDDLAKMLVRLESTYPRCLVCVKVTLLSKGVPSPPAMISLPGEDDIASFVESRCKMLSDEENREVDPVEMPHWDPYRKERKLATKAAKQRRKSKKKGIPPVPQQHPYSFNVFPSRKIIGFITSGDFLNSYASGGGVGFITLKSLLLLCENLKMLPETHSGLIALMRNSNSFQYRFVKLDLMNQ
ncbi:unnamed protein product [Clavelina lepadiformis]|uniref:Uncharacterized protein n=1 Tax=Clavelina lepadiformis TaxID=159417 RepID=A0ABP0H2X3_CLALP